MKYVTLFFITFCLLNSASAIQTDLDCKKPTEQGIGFLIGGTYFYSVFLGSSKSEIKRAYTSVYQDVDDDIEAALKSACSKNWDKASKLNYITAVCLNSCTNIIKENHTTGFRKDVSFKKAKMRVDIKQCHNTCIKSRNLQAQDIGAEAVSIDAFLNVTKDLDKDEGSR